MSQVSYGTITIVDTTDIARIYMVYAKSVSNTTPPSDELTWSESIASAPGEGDFIWQKTVVEKAITEEKTYSDPVCITGSSGQGIEKIINYYCNYGQGQPEEDYSGWQLEIPEYNENKPNYWIKIVAIYIDDTRKDFQASGTIATFESEKIGIYDSLQVNLEPQQDLHGYDKPWVGGAGKNLFNYEDVESLSGIANNNGTFVSTDTDIRTAFAFSVQQYNGSTYVKSNSLNISASGRYFVPITIDSAITKLRIKHNGSSKEFRFDYPFTKEGTFCVSLEVTSADPTVVGGVSFKDVMVESGSTMTAYEPYSNICPISGYDEVEANVTGKNLFDKTATDTENGYVNGRYIRSTDGVTVTLATASVSEYISVKGGTQYVVSPVSGSNPSVCFYDANKTFISGVAYVGATAKDFTTPSNAKYLRFSITNANLDITQVELGSTATDYEPYNTDSASYTASLPETVYGGTVDLVSGVLTVDRVKETYEWSNGAGSWTLGDYTRKVFKTAYASVMQYSGDNIQICDCLPWKHSYVEQSAHFYVDTGNAGSNNCVVFMPNSVTSQTLNIVYGLATPTTIQLTPQQIASFIGDNNVWGSGTIEIKGHTISKKDIIIYKDNGLTDVVNKSAEANTNAAEALEKANDGIISTTQLWYQTNSTSAPSVPTNHSQVDRGSVTYNNWRSIRPNNSVDNYKYYYYCYEYLHGDGTYTYSAEAILDTSNLSQYQIDQLQARIKKIWSNSTGSYMASGIGTNEVDINNSSTYGFNSKSTTTGVSFNYNTIPLTSLGTDGIKLYSPILTGTTITNSRLDATLDTNGLVLKKGGIKSGDPGESGFVYLSTDSYGSYSINGSAGIIDWRQIIGTKFGVRADGTIYANGARFSGNITANEGRIGGFTIDKTSIHSITKTSYNSNEQGIYLRSTQEEKTVTLSTSNYIDRVVDGTEIRMDFVLFYALDKEPYSKDGADLDEDFFTPTWTSSVQSNIDSGYLTYPYISYKEAVAAGQSATQIPVSYTNSTSSTKYIIGFYYSENKLKQGTSYDFNGTVINYVTTTTVDSKFAIGSSSGSHLMYDGTHLDVTGNIEATSFVAKANGATRAIVNTEGLIVYDGNGVADSNILAKFNTNGAQIGQSGAAHSVIDADGQRFYGGSDGTIQLANIGYGEGASTSGAAIAPYYTFGTRASGSNIGNYSMAEGRRTTASGYCSHAEGDETTASEWASHAEGEGTKAIGNYAHAEGHGTTAMGISHAEGSYTTASGRPSHAEGYFSIASGYASHAEGYKTEASVIASHAEGFHAIASGWYTHAQNMFTIATEDSQTVIGKYNAATVSGSGTESDPYVYTDVGDYAFIIGNGTDNTTADRSNAFTVDWNGNMWAENYYPVGSVYIHQDNTNPADILGFGTWTQIHRRFRYAMVENAVTFNSTNVNTATGTGSVCILDGDTAYLRLTVTTKVALTDTPSIEIGTLDFSKIGLTTCYYGQFPFLTDNGNGIAMFSLNNQNGVIKSEDVITKASNGTIAAGATGYCMIPILFARGSMIDSFCNEFHWRRTA